MNNDNTIRFGNFAKNDQFAKDNGNGNLWKKVTLGTISGILLGAGGIRAVDHLETALNEEDADASASENTADTESSAPVYAQAPMAHVSDRMSFDEAFAAARAEVGPGGVFAWHGGIYGTYSADEWESMSDAQRTAFADSVHPEVTPQYVQVAQMSEAHPDVVLTSHVIDSPAKDDELLQTDDVAMRPAINEEDVIDDGTSDDDVRILGHGEVQGHSAVALDLTGNDEADAVIIDVDDSMTLNEPDVVVFREGAVTTIGDIADGTPPVWIDEGPAMTNMENPEVAPDMPDYMDDAAIPM